jgi:uncharacterized damage-inducible protein DinB
MSTLAVTPEQFHQHLQGHRRLTRRLIEAFPDEHFDSFTIGGMRPFSQLVGEMLGIAAPTVGGIATKSWQTFSEERPTTKRAALDAWDQQTAEIDRVFPTIPADRWQEDDVAFGQWPGKCYDLLWYALDNEIHHRGQAFVYLRALGKEPPLFFLRD